MKAKMLKLTFGLLLGAILMSFTTASEKVQWQDWNVALKTAKANKNKIILVDLYTDWCGWCKRMDKDTYENAKVAGLINQGFVAVKLNPEKPGAAYEFEGKKITANEIMQTLATKGGERIQGYPTTIFYHPASEKVIVKAGYQNAEQFSSTLELVKANISQR